MNNVFMNRNFLCIDLKSFFASCECIDRKLDPFTTPLVVANKNQGNGAITLAVTPYLKSKGVKSRGRLYEIPKNIKYIIANPRMNLYIKKSKEVVKIYLNFVAEEDLHIYSIDECFLDVTNYLKMYKKSDYELALEILNTIKEKTGLTATCGIGPNMLLAKVAMDIEAKHNSDCIAKWTYDDIPEKLWTISPLSKMWGIGPNMEKRLNAINIYSIKDLANYNPNKLKDKFGIMGKELWNHANGIDLSRINDFKISPKESSYSHSQILFKDYDETNVKIIISEMVEVITERLRRNHKQSSVIGFGIGYSKSVGGGFYHTVKLDNPTDADKIIKDTCYMIFDRFYSYLPIRKVSVSCGRLSLKTGIQLNIFDSFDEISKTDELNATIDQIKDKFGKNSLLKASNLLKDSTAIMRNNKIGGHNAN